MYALKLTQIGNSVGVVLPKELLARLHVEKGDTVYATESPDGVRLTALPRLRPAAGLHSLTPRA